MKLGGIRATAAAGIGLALLPGLSGCWGEGYYIAEQIDTLSSSSNRSTGPSPTPSPLPPGANGSLEGISPTTGIATGWARDSLKPNTTLDVEFYVGGGPGTGTFLGREAANEQWNFIPVGPYGFTFSVPSAYRDGQLRRLFGYVMDSTTGARIPMQRSPQSMIIGTHQAGLAFYTQTVRQALISSCVECHSDLSVYSIAHGPLADPSAYEGGTATNNTLYRKASGINHGGGSICSGNTAPCPQIRQWWATEFGTLP